MDSDTTNKKILYIDMDNVIVDFESGIKKCPTRALNKYAGRLDEIPQIFSLMEPVEGAIEAVTKLAEKYDVYVLSTSPWNNSIAWKDKVEWIHRYFGKEPHSILYKKLILTHNKHLNIGDYLIDDRLKNGADKFTGELILFGKEHKYKTWNDILDYLL